MDFLVLHSTDHADCIPETPRQSRQYDSLTWEPTRPQDMVSSWGRIGAPLLLYGHGPNAPAQSFSERLELPFSNDEILSGSEDVVSFGTDHFTAWVKVSPH